MVNNPPPGELSVLPGPCNMHSLNFFLNIKTIQVIDTTRIAAVTHGVGGGTGAVIKFLFHIPRIHGILQQAFISVLLGQFII